MKSKGIFNLFSYFDYGWSKGKICTLTLLSARNKESSDEASWYAANEKRKCVIKTINFLVRI